MLLGGKISIVIPVYNSEYTLEILVARVRSVLIEMQREFEIILVDDCSLDCSWDALRKLKASHGPQLKIARLLKNSGQHNAILCGFSLATGDVIVTMDDDLQNPPEEIPKLVDQIDRGYDLAIGAYDYKKHGTLRNASGGLIDRVQRSIFHLPDEFQLTSFRAVRKIVVQNVNHMGGVFPYVTCMLLSHTSKYVNVPVRHDPRVVGDSNYTIGRSVPLVANLIFSYSSLPVTLLGVICLGAFCFSIFLGSVVAIRALLFGSSVPGWSSTVVILSFLNALILMCLFIFGIYLSRFYQLLTRTRVSFTMSELHE